MERLFRDTIRCNGCGKGIQPQIYDVEQEDGSVLRMFSCPRCTREYRVAKITKRGLELTQELQDVELKSPDAETTIKRLRKAIKKEVTRP